MKRLVYISISLLLTISSLAQPVNPDTSYTSYSEYNKLIKDHPYISIPGPFHHANVTERLNIKYGGTANRPLYLDAFYPSKKKLSNSIAIILLHGGGWRSGSRAMMHTLAQRLADMGYTCFTPEYRLSAEALYPAAVVDIKSAIAFVRENAKRYYIDPKKIAIAGHSAGGELAAYMGSTNGYMYFENRNTEVNAVINMDGILAFIHPESGEGDDSKKISAATQWFGKSKTEDAFLWNQASPLTHAGKYNPPTLFINSSVTRMHAGREDFIKILNQHHTYSRVETFENAPHSFILFNPWFERSLGIINNFLATVFSPKRLNTLIVAKDGSGDFNTVQSAINSIPKKNKTPYTIIIKKGIYKEKILIDSLQRYITIIGEDKLNTVLTYDDHTGKLSPAGDTINTRTSWSFKIKADNFTAKNISFQNDAGFSAGQAVAVESNGDKAVFTNCRFIGNQDVLFTNSDKSRQYFEDCYIEGTTDFIFGSATAWFERCSIYSKKNSHITAASTPKEKAYGYVFNWCELSGDTSLQNVSLGRPWRPYANVIYKNCYIGAHIKPEGWSNWNNTENYKTVRYAEYANFGPSADPAKRVSWSRQLSKAEAQQVTLEKVLGGWKPK